ncbi:MAG: hypothetical protein J6M46_02575 [Lachnospiraceae bacterium]|nr:hypothetical protein [Lachnospiraceae bacterium]
MSGLRNLMCDLMLTGQECPENLEYCIMDPTGNITALVESSAEVSRQPFIADQIMRSHPEVEQVGFVEFKDVWKEPDFAGTAYAKLRMAGGEFCGNASMCAAALYLSRKGANTNDWQQVQLEVSGTSERIEVRLRPIAAEGADFAFEAGVRMPRALRIEKRLFADGALQGELPLVRMEGISHIIIEPSSVFYAYREDRAAAERAVQKWCKELGADGLGLMFLDVEESRLTPLVYVPGSGTSFWENSCASGSAATGMYLADRTGARQEISLREPGGSLKVTSDPGSGETWLYGTVRW